MNHNKTSESFCIHTVNLGKAYKDYSSEWRRIASWMGIRTRPIPEKRVLRNISFRMGQGEAIGIVGQNGAGKSTLLKLISGTLHPSEGHIHISGRISAILELGMGFNPELTGRQNALHTLGLLGFPHKQIMDLLPGIEDFAEINSYFDEPVRTLSSGMQMRIAFGVATCVRPDILIIDEALSVGDAYFQHKSFDRIRKFREAGTSMIIVSHDKNAIQTFCDRAILLDKGNLLMDNTPESVLDYYNALIAEKESCRPRMNYLENKGIQTISGTGEAEVETLDLLDSNGHSTEEIHTGEPVCLRIKVSVKEDIPELVIGYVIKNRLGQDVFGTNTHNLGCSLLNLRAGEKPEYHFYFPANLAPGSYSLALALHRGADHLEYNYEWRNLALMFHVRNTHHPVFSGLTWIPPKVEYAR
ncbi:ABC transporter ATP-binding protein [Desulfobotulus mexicanus]|uniref:ABC transporter ATP-binding protein n=1 Tax=Desulfobotulus mexicanus TaxID=2586642 RepID=A0A5Q4VED7_9BACT|nr:ABC transporter ATP-binding protein [Desulfobotulus mexicanus]TYT75296.1 ABC transporter ATP-binding protein [Desulfobotulus mexicanus]